MSKDEEYIDIEITEEEQTEIVNDLITLGQYKKIEPLKFALGLIKLASIICENEQLELSNLVTMMIDDEVDPYLH